MKKTLCVTAAMLLMAPIARADNPFDAFNASEGFVYRLDPALLNAVRTPDILANLEVSAGVERSTAAESDAGYFVGGIETQDIVERVTTGVNYTVKPGLSFSGIFGIFDVKQADTDSSEGHYFALTTDWRF